MPGKVYKEGDSLPYGWDFNKAGDMTYVVDPREGHDSTLPRVTVPAEFAVVEGHLVHDGEDPRVAAAEAAKKARKARGAY